ncbi:TetR family transcriptional regulator [Niabella terrae]
MSKKEYILQKAEQLFAEKGFDATSVRDIAKAAGINIAMISYYFGSKEKLMEALFAYRTNVGLAFIREITADPNLTVVQKIEKALSGYVDRVKNHGNFYKVILAEQTINKNRNVLKVLTQSRETYVEFFGKALEEGYRQGLLKNQMDPVLYITTITGTLMQSFINKKLYAAHCGIKPTDQWLKEVYFEKVKQHLKTISRNILGYEVEQ